MLKKIDSRDVEFPEICPNCGAPAAAIAEIYSTKVYFCDECFVSWQIINKAKDNIKKNPRVKDWIINIKPKDDTKNVVS